MRDEDLRDTVEDGIDEYGWAARCLQDEEVFAMPDEVEASYLAGVDREVRLASRHWGFSSGTIGISTVYLRDLRLEAAEPLVSIEGQRYFCLRPANLP